MTDNTDDDPRHWELEAISSIYPEIERRPNYEFSLSLKPTPGKPWKIRFPSTNPEAPTPRIQYLPPISLNISLPNGYPEETPPKLRVNSEWLPDKIIADIEREGKNIWESNGQTESIYDIVDFVLRGIDTGFGLFEGDTWNAPDWLKGQLLSTDKRRAKEEFESGTYVCGICLDPCKGSVSHKLSHCGHVFCISCLQDLYKSAIKTGEVSMVRCPDPACVPKKKKAFPLPPPPAVNLAIGNAAPTVVLPVLEYNPVREPPMPPTINPYELQQLKIPQDYISRYLFMKRKIYLDADPRTIVCPRHWCQAHSRSAIDLFESMLRAGMLGEYFVGEKPTASPFSIPTRAEQAKDRLDICSKCNFAFCKRCEASWHGESVICRGKNHIKSEEEIKDEKYIESITTYCPSCECPVLKSEGCNHITCRCGLHFCFLCGEYLSPDQPYAHYNTKGKACYMKLWEGEDPNNMPLPGEFQGEV